MADSLDPDILDCRVTCGVFRKKDGKYGVIPWIVDKAGKFKEFAVKNLEKDYNWWTLERIKDPMFGFFCWKMLKEKGGWDLIQARKPK